MIENRNKNNLRLIAIGLSLGWLLWLSYEDQSTTFVLLFAVSFCGWGWINWRQNQSQRPNALGLVISGMLAGIIVAPLASAMLLFKGGLHQHGFAEITIPQFIAILKQTPWWGMGGGLLGIVFWLGSQEE